MYFWTTPSGVHSLLNLRHGVKVGPGPRNSGPWALGPGIRDLGPPSKFKSGTRDLPKV